MPFTISFAEYPLNNEHFAFIAGLSFGFFVCTYIPRPGLFKSTSSKDNKKRTSDHISDQKCDLSENTCDSCQTNSHGGSIDDEVGFGACDRCHFIKCFDLDCNRGPSHDGLMVVEMPSFRVLHINYELQKFLHLPFDVNMWQYVPDACHLRDALLKHHQDEEYALKCVETPCEVTVLSYLGTSLKVKVIAKRLDMGKELDCGKQVYYLLFNGI
uniref:Uncharacterized protein n=1 Tax=Hanusia phi TaxID=3032 RepID=A0A7S0DYH0_9CRYP|mmetsp:Transcript_12295/g.28387  ORF Transcript_12295/g.28387 Transcript_12295/m.28387 type:complete len:213 (+) Transcript_12295:141-779(+)